MFRTINNRDEKELIDFINSEMNPNDIILVRDMSYSQEDGRQYIKFDSGLEFFNAMSKHILPGFMSIDENTGIIHRNRRTYRYRYINIDTAIKEGLIEDVYFEPMFGSLNAKKVGTILI